MNLRSAMKLDGACIWITAATTHRTLLRNYSGWNAYRKFKWVFFSFLFFSFQKCYTTHVCFNTKKRMDFFSCQSVSRHAILSELQGLDATPLRPRASTRWVPRAQCRAPHSAVTRQQFRCVPGVQWLGTDPAPGTSSSSAICDLSFHRKNISCDLWICDCLEVEEGWR